MTSFSFNIEQAQGGSIEYVGETLPPETLTALVATLQKLGIVKDKTEVGA